MFNFPWSNFHELNLDWILKVVKEAKDVWTQGRTDIDYAVATADEAKEIATQAAQAQVADNSVSTSKIQDGAVTNVKLADDSVSSAKLIDYSVTASKIGTGVVTTRKIADGNVTKAKLSADVQKTLDLADMANHRFLYIGDSYEYVTTERWTDIVDAGLGVSNSVVVAQGGYGFNPSNGKTWISLLQNTTIANENTITDILICGGANDAWTASFAGIPTAITAFASYCRGRFTGLKNIYLAFAGNSFKTYGEKTNMCRVFRAYTLGAKYNNIVFLNGVENTLLDPTLVQNIDNNDYIHPTINGVREIGYNLVSAINTGYARNIHEERGITFTKNTLLFNSGTFNITETLIDDNLAFTVPDISCTPLSSVSGFITLATCPELSNMILGGKYYDVSLRIPGSTITATLLMHTNYNTLGLILPGGVTISSAFTIVGFSAVQNQFSL